MFLSIYDQRRRLFFFPNIYGSNHDLIIRTRDLSRSIPRNLISFSIQICEIFGFFLFLYPYPIGITFGSIEKEPFLLYESILLHSNSFPIPPRKIPNWIQNWRVSVSLSMRLCILQIGINFLKDPGFRALVSRPRSFRWPMLCWRDIHMIWSIACVRPAVATEPGKVYRKDSSFLLYLFYYISIS